VCGRFTVTTPADVVADIFGVDAAPQLAPRYNVAPTQTVAIVRAGTGRREMALARWGLIPFWAKDPAIGNRLINARAETVAEKPAFRAAFRKRRCLVPADGFYEWQKRDGAKQPYLIHGRDRRPLAMAGLWESWLGPDDEPLESFTIITTQANGLMKPIHHRMPVILPAALHDDWLGGGAGDVLVEMLTPCADDVLIAEPVSTHVNNPRHDDAKCVEPVGEP